MATRAPPPPSIHFPIDDCDLDDAELWAVIDSAAASRPRKPLLLKNAAPISHSLPKTRVSDVESRVFSDGEVVQEEHWPQRRPPKMARSADSPIVTFDQRMMVVKNSYSPKISPAMSSPASAMAYSPPASAKYSVSPVVESPKSDQFLSEEKNGRHSLSGQFPSVSLFKQYQNAAMAILEKTDYTMISGNPFIKKSGWRKIGFFFNLSFEIKDKSIEYDENRNVQRAEFVIRSYMQGGRFSDGWGSCDRREKRFMKPNHDIPSTAETRAKNKACQDLLGIGDYRSGVKL